MGIINRLLGSPEPDEGTFPLPVDEYSTPDHDDNDAANKHPDDPPPSMLEPKSVTPKPKPKPRKRRRS